MTECIITPDDPGEAWTEGRIFPLTPRDVSRATIAGRLWRMCERGVLTDSISRQPRVVTPDQFIKKWPDFVPPLN